MDRPWRQLTALQAVILHRGRGEAFSLRFKSAEKGARVNSLSGKFAIPTVTEPGYIYIFVLNKSEDTEVWFDDLKVTHTRSSIVAGADYYPFGLVMDSQIKLKD